MKLDRVQRVGKEAWLADARRKIEEGWQAAQTSELLDSEEVFEELRREIGTDREEAGRQAGNARLQPGSGSREEENKRPGWSPAFPAEPIR